MGKVLKATYLRNNSLFSCKQRVDGSPVWCGILSTKEVILKGVCFSLDNGVSIDPWILSTQGKAIRWCNEHSNLHNFHVRELLFQDSNSSVKDITRLN